MTRRSPIYYSDSQKALNRARRDEDLAPQIRRVWQANLQVYGADKVCRQLAREGTAVARARWSG